jgi:hypothetical protein
MQSGVFDLSGWRIAVVMAEDTSNDPSLFQRAPTNEGDPVAECLTGGADALVCLGAMPFAAHHIERQENTLPALRPATAFLRCLSTMLALWTATCLRECPPHLTIRNMVGLGSFLRKKP